jgi:histidinol-phosphate/aromatic aminotransferase/cobyric acid decarboxylase-like protein
MTTDGHGGNQKQLVQLAGKVPDEILDCSANINPLGPPDWLRLAKYCRATLYGDGEMADG